MRSLHICGWLAFASVLTGCSALPTVFTGTKAVIEATRENPAVEIVCLWEPAEGRDPNGMPARGFNGQCLFFVKGNDAPARVDGEVKIYVFDDYGPREQWSKPVGEFEFAAHEWATFQATGMLGPSYQLFVPYMRKHSDQVNCSMRVRFTPADGGPAIYSRVTKITLPGLQRDAVTDGSIEQKVEWREQARQQSAAVPLEGVQLAKPDPARVSTIHRWESHGPMSSQTLMQPAVSEILPASATQSSDVPEPDASPLFDESVTEEAPRHRFRLEGLIGRVSK